MRTLVPLAFALAAWTGQPTAPSPSIIRNDIRHEAVSPGAMPVGWGSLSNPAATVREVIANNKMVIRGNARAGLTVARFEIFLFTDAVPKNERSIKIDGNCLDKRAIGLINQLRSGDRIMFNNIALVDAGNSARYADDFAIDIK